jgi:hypothetical protein
MNPGKGDENEGKAPVMKHRNQDRERKNEEQLPINLCKSTDDVFNYLIERIMGQQRVLATLSPLLWRFYNKSGTEDRPRDRINLVLFSGPSTTGKTETCGEIASLFGLQGTKKYIQFDLATIVDESQVNQLLGAGPGLVGSDSNNALPFMLLEAIGRPHVEEDADCKKPTNANARRNRQEPPPTPPPLVLIHMDELDKAHPKILTPLLNFVDTGILRASNGVTFTLPEQTRLLFLFSANYAADAIRHMASKEIKEAVGFIKSEMKAQGILEPVINRFHQIVPFFPLSLAEKERLGDKKILESLDRLHKENNKFFVDVDSTERMKSLLCNAIKAEATDESGEIGFRQLHSATENKFGELLQRAVSTIEGATDDHFALPLQPNPEYVLKSVTREDFPKLQSLVTLVPKLFPPLDRMQLANDLGAVTDSDAINFICLTYKMPEGPRRTLSAMLTTNDNTSANVTSVDQPALQHKQQHFHGTISHNNKKERLVDNGWKECRRCGEVRPREEFPQYKRSKQLSDDSMKEYTCYRDVCTACKTISV